AIMTALPTRMPEGGSGGAFGLERYWQALLNALATARRRVRGRQLPRWIRTTIPRGKASRDPVMWHHDACSGGRHGSRSRCTFSPVASLQATRRHPPGGYRARTSCCLAVFLRCTRQPPAQVCAEPHHTRWSWSPGEIVLGGAFTTALLVDRKQTLAERAAGYKE